MSAAVIISAVVFVIGVLTIYTCNSIANASEEQENDQQEQQQEYQSQESQRVKNQNKQAKVHQQPTIPSNKQAKEVHDDDDNELTDHIQDSQVHYFPTKQYENEEDVRVQPTREGSTEVCQQTDVAPHLLVTDLFITLSSAHPDLTYQPTSSEEDTRTEEMEPDFQETEFDKANNQVTVVESHIVEEARIEEHVRFAVEEELRPEEEPTVTHQEVKQELVEREEGLEKNPKDHENVEEKELEEAQSEEMIEQWSEGSVRRESVKPWTGISVIEDYVDSFMREPLSLPNQSGFAIGIGEWTIVDSFLSGKDDEQENVQEQVPQSEEIRLDIIEDYVPGRYEKSDSASDVDPVVENDGRRIHAQEVVSQVPVPEDIHLDSIAESSMDRIEVSEACQRLTEQSSKCVAQAIEEFDDYFTSEPLPNPLVEPKYFEHTIESTGEVLRIQCLDPALRSDNKPVYKKNIVSEKPFSFNGTKVQQILNYF